jgi:hypothetical protein
MKENAARWAAVAAMALATGIASAERPPPLAPGDGRLCFYRETWHALSVQPEVTVSGVVVGTAIPNAWFCVDRKAGTYEISTVSEPDRKFSLTLASGETRYASLEFTVTWFLVAHINPVLVDNVTGEKGIAGLHYRKD